MMNCPSCKRELAIGHSYVSVEDGKAYTVQTFFCRNPSCRNRQAKIPVMQLKHPHNDTPPELGDITTCCGNTLLKMDGGGYFVPDNLTAKESGGELRVACPKCGRTHSVSIEGKTKV